MIDFEEFVMEAPRTLRVSLVKLAKKNGHDLGFLVCAGPHPLRCVGA